jgi:hypothetical protein
MIRLIKDQNAWVDFKPCVVTLKSVKLSKLMSVSTIWRAKLKVVMCVKLSKLMSVSTIDAQTKISVKFVLNFDMKQS